MQADVSENDEHNIKPANRCYVYISVTLLLEILHVPVLHPLLDPLLVLLRCGGAAGVQRVVGPVHVGTPANFLGGWGIEYKTDGA